MIFGISFRLILSLNGKKKFSMRQVLSEFDEDTRVR